MKTPETQIRYDKIVKDATHNMLVHVKPEDIQGALCRDHQKCVVARAIMRQRSKGAPWVDVGNSVILIGTGKKTGIRFTLGSVARNQIRFFDENDGRFAPCVIKLTAPKTHGHRPLGSRKGQSARSGPSGKMQKTRQSPTR